jgi:pectin methylesterase-like acyl-CoA thioesterase
MVAGATQHPTPNTQIYTFDMPTTSVRIINRIVAHTLFTPRRLQTLDEPRAYFQVKAALLETRKMVNFIVGPDDYLTIAAAIDAASQCDTISLSSSYSDETVTVTKNDITIFGSSSSHGIAQVITDSASGLALSGDAPINVTDSGGDDTIFGNDGDNVITVTGGSEALLHKSHPED